MELSERGDWKADVGKLGTLLAKARGAEEVGERNAAIRHYSDALALLVPMEGGTIQTAILARLATLRLASGIG